MKRKNKQEEFLKSLSQKYKSASSTANGIRVTVAAQDAVLSNIINEIIK